MLDAGGSELPPQTNGAPRQPGWQWWKNELVKEWRVYADSKPVYDILARSGSRL
jgi:hypothetical protein